MVRVMTRAFEKSGFHTVHALNGRDGISRAIEHQPKVMVVDLVMPGISGLDLIDELRTLPATRNVPVVVFTGTQLSEEETVLVKARAQAVVFKPALDELIRVVSAVARK